MKRLLLATVAMMAATPAFAADTTTTNGATVAFTGSVTPVCEVRNYENAVSFGTLSAVGAGAPVSDTLSVYCNTKFNASITSQQGYLRLVTADPLAAATNEASSNFQALGYTGWASGVDYQVATPVGTASTASLTASTPFSFGTVPPTNAGGTITYTTVPGSLQLLAGTYADSVVLTLSPIPF